VESRDFWLLWLRGAAMSLPPAPSGVVVNRANYFFFGHFLAGLRCFDRWDLEWVSRLAVEMRTEIFDSGINSLIGSTI
jgi:hypothetical protein